MTKTFLTGAAGALALALAACGGNETEVPEGEGAMADQTSLAEDAAPQPGTPQHFAGAVAASDAFEIESSRLAQERASSQEVKDYAAKMIEDHTTSTNNLREAVSGVEGVDLNPQMTPEQQQNLEELRNASDDFDEVYVRQQVAAHEAALTLLRDYNASGDVAALKTFAGNTAGIVEGHLEMARELP